MPAASRRTAGSWPRSAPRALHLAAERTLGPRALHLAAERTLGIHPYLTVPDHTRAARQIPGPDAVIAPEHKIVLDTDPDRARAAGRAFVPGPYLKLSTYTTSLRRYGYTDAGTDPIPAYRQLARVLLCPTAKGTACANAVRRQPRPGRLGRA
jgi:hypothetical protein